MYPRYHRAITTEALGPYFAPAALQQIVRANVAQDSLISLFGTHPQHHFDDDRIAEGRAYIESQHREIAALAADPQAAPTQRAALGRLLHAAQDWYSHSNYVDLWLDAHGGLVATSPRDIDGLEPSLLNDPRLRTGHFIPLWSFLYYVPLLKHLARRIFMPANSHEAMNLDSPQKGRRFAYALAAAQQRTVSEYRRAAQAVLEGGGAEALQRFHTC
jgi:hypothetical protein